MHLSERKADGRNNGLSLHQHFPYLFDYLLPKMQLHDAFGGIPSRGILRTGGVV